MKRLLPILLMALLVGACGTATPSESPSTAPSESPVAEVTPSPDPSPVGPLTVDTRMESYGDTGFVDFTEDEELGGDDYSAWATKTLSTGVQVAATLHAVYDDAFGNYPDPAFRLFNTSWSLGASWKKIPQTFGEFCQSPPALFTALAEAPGWSTKLTFRPETPVEVPLFGRSARGFVYYATASDYRSGSWIPAPESDLLGAFYCVEASDLIADEDRLEEFRGRPLYLVYHVEVVASLSDFDKAARSAIVTEGLNIPASLANGAPIIVSVAEYPWVNGTEIEE